MWQGFAHRTVQKPLTPKRCWKLSHGSVTFSLLIDAWKRKRKKDIQHSIFHFSYIFCMINYYRKKKKKAVKKQDCSNTSHTSWDLQSSVSHFFVSFLHFPRHLGGHFPTSKQLHFSCALRTASKAAFSYKGIFIYL